MTFRSGNSQLLNAKKFFKIGIGERGGELTYEEASVSIRRLSCVRVSFVSIRGRSLVLGGFS